MKKIWKLLMLIAGLGLLGTGFWRGYYVLNLFVLGAAFGGGYSIIISIIIGFLVFAFTLQTVFSSMMVFFKGDDKNFKKAVLASIFVIGLTIADLILVSVNVCKILILVSACVLLFAALMFKFGKPERVEEKTSNDNPTE